MSMHQSSRCPGMPPSGDKSPRLLLAKGTLGDERSGPQTAPCTGLAAGNGDGPPGCLVIAMPSVEHMVQVEAGRDPAPHASTPLLFRDGRHKPHLFQSQEDALLLQGQAACALPAAIQERGGWAGDGRGGRRRSPRGPSYPDLCRGEASDLQLPPGIPRRTVFLCIHKTGAELDEPGQFLTHTRKLEGHPSRGELSLRGPCNPWPL
ncbi:unnamed protein product [Lepidochelys kempii]